MCLNSWGMNSYAKALVEISTDNDFVESLFVAVPIDKGKGHCMVSINIEFECRPPRCLVCKIFDHVDRECHKNRKEDIRNTNMEDGFPKGKPKLIYMPIAKQNLASTSKLKDNTPPITKEDVNVACDKPSASSNVFNDDFSRSTNKNVKSKFIQDDMYDVGDTKVVSTSLSEALAKVNGSEKGNFLKQILKSCEASKNRYHSSMSDSDESEVEEVYLSGGRPGGGTLDFLEDDLDGYDRYEAQFYDLTKRGQAFCDQSLK
ncbi:hypothetical protein Tco_0452436 [Tanacetum coccineum]